MLKFAILLTTVFFVFFEGTAFSRKFEIPPRFDYADPFSDGVALVRVRENFFYIDKTGKVVIRPDKFDSYDRFSNGLAVVFKGKKAGYIDKTGRLAIATRFAYARAFKDERAIICFEKTTLSSCPHGVIDKHGKVVVNPYLSVIFDYSEGFASANFGDNIGLPTVGMIDIAGQKKIPAIYKYIYPLSDGVSATLTEKNGWGHLRPDGTWAIQPKFDSLGDRSDGLVLFGDCGEKKEDAYTLGPLACKYGFLDYAGNIIIPAQFRAATNFSESRAAVSFNVRPTDRSIIFLPKPGITFGYIDKSGRVTIDPIYSQVGRFIGGVALVREAIDEKREGKYGFIDKTGRQLTGFIYEYASEISEGLAAVQDKTGKFGYLKFD